MFPPHWYYSCPPADLVYTGAHLARAGIATRCFDLNSGLSSTLLGSTAGLLALRQPSTYADSKHFSAASADVTLAESQLSSRYQTYYSFSYLNFPDIDEGHIGSALRVGLDPQRNPALAYLQSQIPEILKDDPALIAVALVFPAQIVQVSVLGRLLRQAGYRGFLVLYGAHEDVMAPEDIADDLIAAGPKHELLRDYDGAIIGEAETALCALHEALCGKRPRESVPHLFCPAWGLTGMPERGYEDLKALAPADFSWVRPERYPYPTPVVDLRLSRGCPWGRCTFCAITMHQDGYRSRPSTAGVEDLLTAHRQLKTNFFRFRDDLLTPKQLRDLTQLCRSLPFRPRFSARARFEPGFTRQVLQDAADAGLEELWLGLESAVPRVRDLMDKGVTQPIIERILCDAELCGIRVRALCIFGHPGETAAEMRETFAFLHRHLFHISSVSPTRFLLMRSAPLGKVPEKYGITVFPEPLPVEQRIRHTLKGRWDNQVPTEEFDRIYNQNCQNLFEWTRKTAGGPTLAHAWIHESVQRRGWPERTVLLPLASTTAAK